MKDNTKNSARKPITAIRFAAIMLVSVVLLLAPTTSAIVTTDLDPESGPATCPAGCGLEDFESGTDGMYGGGPPIASTIPGVSFVTTEGQDWWTGDWAVGLYNGKYPTGGIYTSGGQKWAWLGVSQGSGIIDFTMGEASYVSVYTSTSSGMVMDAYEDDDTFLASSGWASDNTNTGKMTMLSISRPTADIGYVIVHDTGNYWLIDWLCTDAPGFANQPPVADAGSDQTVEQTYYQGADVPLDGSGSSDPDGDPLTYSWTWAGGSATGVSPTVSLPLGETTITLVVNDGTVDSAPDTVVITVQDTTPPVPECLETVNPHGNKVPPAGSTTLPGPKGGQNEDGFYELIATDLFGPDPEIFVVDMGSGTEFGPFVSGTTIKYTQNLTAAPEAKPIGSSRGQAGAIDWHIIGNGDATLKAVDFSGNVATVSCLVPPPPK